MSAIVILNYNSHELIDCLVQEIIQYSNLEKIVIVDNNSTKESVEHLERISILSKKIILLKSKKNLGYSGGNNIGLEWLRKNTQIDYVFVANPDVKFTEKFVTTIITTFEKEENAEYGLLTGIMLNPDDSIADNQYWYIPSYREELVKNFLLLNFLFKQNNKLLNSTECKESDIIDVVPAGSLICLRLSSFSSEKIFDEEFFLFYEENVLCKKLSERGKKFGIVGSTTYNHYHSQTIGNFLNFSSKLQIFLQSKILFQEKYNGIGNIRSHLLKVTNFVNLKLLTTKFRLRNGK